jgi:hypothetical protein
MDLHGLLKDSLPNNNNNNNNNNNLIISRLLVNLRTQRPITKMEQVRRNNNNKESAISQIPIKPQVTRVLFHAEL